MLKEEIELETMWPLMKEVLDSGGEFEMFPRGTSMLPLLRQGQDSVSLVSPNDLKVGDIAFYLRDDGHFVLHRVIQVENDTYTMCGDNQFSLEKGIRKDQLLAKVLYFVKDGKRIDETDRKYARYIKSLPYRRLYKKARSFLSKIKHAIVK